MRRRDFIKSIAGSTVAWPLAARAEQFGQTRRIGVLMGYDEDDPEAQYRLAAFERGLAEAGWMIGRNLELDQRWGSGDIERIKHFATELVGA
jgi:putative ABC transport system substrate-binding protein